MSRRSILLLVVTVLLLVNGFWWLVRHRREEAKQPEPQVKLEVHKTKPGSSTVASQLPNREEMLQKIREESRKPWLTPISFYGKVVDENDKPVAGVTVEFGWNTLSGGHSDVRTSTDGQGLFSLTGVQGKRLLVSVNKDGYYTWHARNQGSFEYAEPSERIYHVPDPNNPVVFHLKKKGESEPLIKREKNFAVRKDGTPVQINLRTGKAVPAGQGDMQVECWTADQFKDRMNRYNWRCRITVHNGGLIESSREFDFEAPENGYRVSDEIEMPMTLGDQWKSNFAKKYFLKLGNGNFASLKFEMIAGGDHFCALDYYLNPTGSRNLEYDPAKEIKPGK